MSKRAQRPDILSAPTIEVEAFNILLPRPITKIELARFLAVSERTIDNYVSDRVIPYIKIGANIRFQLADVQKALKRFTVREVR